MCILFFLFIWQKQKKNRKINCTDSRTNSSRYFRVRSRCHQVTRMWLEWKVRLLMTDVAVPCVRNGKLRRERTVSLVIKIFTANTFVQIKYNMLEFFFFYHHYRHGQIRDSFIHGWLPRDLFGVLDRSGGLLEKITGKHHGHGDSDVIRMSVYFSKDISQPAYIILTLYADMW